MTTRIIVFAKAPQPGAVKTRLIGALGPVGAAALHERLVLHALATATSAGMGSVELCCSPDTRHAFFGACAGTYGVALTAQGEGDLGERMQHAAIRALAEHRAVVMIGADCPALASDHLRAAAAALDEGDDAAVTPAEDGGYVLLALRCVDPVLFSGIQWGSTDVMSATAERLDMLGWRWRKFATLWDVDRPADLIRLRRLGPAWQ